MTEHEQALKRAAAKYLRAKDRAAEIERKASAELADAMRTAFTDWHMKKADILKATDHVWSRTWLDKALADGQPEPTKE